MKIHKDSRGDTIVEVLIALVELTSVLVGAYVTANKSQNANRASQERGEATKAAEGQLEALKGLLASGNPPSSTKFCVLADNSGYANLISDPFTEPLDSGTLPYQPTQCADRDCRYNVVIEKSVDTYKIRVRWNRINGGRDQIDIYYRAYQ
jgi:hypothetical protein